MSIYIYIYIYICIIYMYTLCSHMNSFCFFDGSARFSYSLKILAMNGYTYWHSAVKVICCESCLRLLSKL